MRRRPVVLLALVIAACARGGNAPKPDLIATYEACLAAQVYQTALNATPGADAEAFAAYSRARWRAYAAHDSAVNHARNAPADSARFQHHAKLHFGAAQARDRRMRAANLATYYAESLADAAAANACRANTATETAAR